MNLSLDYQTAARYYKMINDTNNPYTKSRLIDSFSPNQIDAKLWMLDELSNAVDMFRKNFDNPVFQFDNVEIIGSWFGWPLIDMMEKWETLHFDTYDLWDIDKNARIACRKYIKMFGMQDRINLSGKDYWKHERRGSGTNLVINTSSEHMKETFSDLEKIKKNFFGKNPLIVVQSNNMTDVEEHINCCNSAEELVAKHKFTKVLFSGEQPIMDLSGKDYTRYMVIGSL